MTIAGPILFEHSIVSEQLFLSTVRLELWNSSGSQLGSGTGFFYCPNEDKPNELLIVSNKHVLNHSVSLVTMSLPEATPDGQRTNGRRRHFRWTRSQKRPILAHKTPYIDIAALRFDSAEEEGGADWELLSPSDTDAQLAIAFFTAANIHNDTYLRETMLGISNVFMIGYPDPLYDAVNQPPISRAGCNGFTSVDKLLSSH